MGSLQSYDVCTVHSRHETFEAAAPCYCVLKNDIHHRNIVQYFEIGPPND